MVNRTHATIMIKISPYGIYWYLYSYQEKIISVLVNERYIYSYENNIINDWDYECGVRIDESKFINQV